MLAQLLAALCVATCRQRLQIGGQWRLGVYRQYAAAGQVDHHVGAAGCRLRLFLEVHVGGHAGQLHHPPELQLAPAPAGAGTLERLAQRGGGPLQLLLLLGQRAQLLQQAAVGSPAALFQFVNLVLQPVQVFPQGSHQPAQLGLVRAQAALQLAVELAQ